MPGLIGIVSEDALNEQLLNRMIDSSKHEEFHKVDKYFNQNFACARIHLGIFNLELQPAFNEDKSLCIFMDGKIYGYTEQLNELKKRGHQFNSENDLEFCLHSYEEYGKDFVKRLNGSFVLLIYDFRNRKTIIANDRFGFRVHYYAINNGKLLFAPDAKTIFQDLTFIKELNDEAVAEYFAFGEFWGDKTLFKRIKILTPASILIYNGQDLSIEKYWEIKYTPDYNKSEDEFVIELVKTFKKAIEIRLKDDLRYGVTLSGGLDSRSILAGIAPAKRKDVTACTFGPEDCDEVKIAKKIAKAAGVKEHLIQGITPELFVNNAEKEIWLNEGRNTIGVSFTYPILKAFRRRVDVVFDGFAMDLTLGGSYLNKDKVHCKTDNLLLSILSRKRFYQDDEMRKVLTTDYYNRVKDIPAKSFYYEYNRLKSEHPGNKSDEFSLNTHVAWIHIGDVTVRELVEVSHPSGDNDFIDILLTIPPELRLNHYIYRKFLMELSPELVKIPYNRTMVRADAPVLFWKFCETYLIGREFIKKRIHQISKGMLFLPDKTSYVNFYGWFHTSKEWQGFLRELFLKENDTHKELLNQNYIEKLFQEQVAKDRDNSSRLLHIASFKIFLKSFF